MKRMVWAAAAAALCAAVLCACGGLAELPGPEEAQQAAYFQAEGTPGYRVEVYPTPVPDGYGAGCIAANRTALFYSAGREQPMGQMATATELYRLDLSTGGTRRIYQHESEGHWVNELAVTDSSLFWVIREGEEMRMERLDLDTGTIEALRTWQGRAGDIILTGGDSYLLWYEQENGKNALFCYDEGAEEIYEVSHRISAENPIDRAYVDGGVTAFLESRGGRQVLCSYDLAEREYLDRVACPKEWQPRGIAADGQRFLLADRDKDGLWTYDPVEECLYQVWEGDCFSRHLLDGMVLVNDKWGSGQLLGRSAEGGPALSFTAGLPGEHAYTLCMSANGAFHAYDDTQRAIVCITPE